MPSVGDLYNPHKIFTGVYIPDSLVCSTELSPGAKLAFGRLCWYAGKNGACFPTAKTLGEDIGVAQRTAYDYIAELEKLGLITHERQGRSSNTYYFVWHQILEDSLKVKTDMQDSAHQTRQVEIAESANMHKLQTEYAEIAVPILREVLIEENNFPEKNNTDQCDQEKIQDGSANATPEECLRLWIAHRGFKKPSSAQRKKVLERIAQVEASPETWSTVMNAYYDSDYGKKNDYPIWGFLKNPLSWSRSTSAPTPHQSQPKPIKIEQRTPANTISIANLEKQLETSNPVQWKHYKAYFPKLNERHKNRNDFEAGQKYLINLLIDSKIWMYEVDMKHRTYCVSENWKWANYKNFPTLYQWLIDEKYKYWEPSIGPVGHYWVEYEKAINEAKAYENSKLELVVH